MTPFHFEPFIIPFLPNNYYVNYNYSDSNNGNLEEEKSEKTDLENNEQLNTNEEIIAKTSYLKKQRNIIISDPNVK